MRNSLKPEMGTKKRSTNLTRVISVTSGKGGTGKTHTVVNLAIALARLGKSVLILDADLGLANVDVILGLTPAWTINDVLSGTKSLGQIMLRGPEGISILPSASGVESLCSLSSVQRLALLQQVEEVAAGYDYLLIDTGAGIGSEVMYFNTASAEIICVITPDPTSLTDAYALIKVLAQNYKEKEVSILANNVPNEDVAKRSFKRLSRAVERFLHVNLRYIGFIPTDAAVVEAIGSQRALLEVFPSSPSGLALAGIARRIDTDFLDFRIKGGMQFFFRQLLEMSSSGG